MADCHIWEEDPVNLRVVAKGATYEKSKSYTFTFKNVDGGEELGTAQAAATPAKGGTGVEATGKLEKAKKPADVSNSNDKLWYAASYELDAGGTKLQNFPDKLFVYARTIKVTAKNKADGKAYKGAVCVLEQTQASTKTSKTLDGGPGGVEEGPQRWATDDKGEVTIRLKYPSPNARIVFQRPYYAEWTKETGAERTVNITYAPSVRFLFPRQGKKEHRQYVNLTAVADRATPAGDDYTTPEWKSYLADMSKGRTIRIKVAPSKPDEWVAGQKVYMKATFDAGNTARTNPKKAHAEKKPGEVLEKEVTPGPDGLAVFDIDLGLAGGDKIVVEVGTVKGTADAKMTIRTWRKLFYELIAPTSLADTLPAVTLPDGTAAFDVPKKSRKQVEEVLDPTYVEYVLLGAAKVADATLADHQKCPDKYMGGSTNDTLIMYGGTGGTPNTFAGTDKDHTIDINLCHKTWSSTKKTVPEHEQIFDDATKIKDDGGKKYFVIDLSTVADGTYLFPKHPADGQAGIHKAHWYAQPQKANLLHPGYKLGKAKEGVCAIKYVNASTVEVEIPASVAAFVGKKSAKKCPVKIKLKTLCFASSTNGSANNGRQVLTIKSLVSGVVKAAGKTMCHELGHSMGMTIVAGRNQPPDGLEEPKHVDNGGTYYLNGAWVSGAANNGIRKCHKGPHCAEGVADKTKGSFSDGTCIMFGAGGVHDKRDSYCATCTKYIKARNLTNIRDWDGRAADDC